MKIKCPQCDFKNEEGNKFCKNCNAPLYKQDYSEDNPYIKRRGKRRKKKNENKDQPFELISKIFDLKTSSVEEVVEYIKNKRIANRRKFHENLIKAEKLIEYGKFEEAQKLTQEDVIVYSHVYAEAEKKEKAGKLEEAVKLYWTNISTNGTDAPANFTRLMVILKKLGRLSEASKISEIYDKYFYRKMT